MQTEIDQPRHCSNAVDTTGNQLIQKPEVPLCAGCQDAILDHYLLKVSPDLAWHTSCLKCCQCGQTLDETKTCFLRDNKIYCKRDYYRLGLQKCCRCDVVFGGSDPVIRTSSAIYHPDCFRCLACNRQILTGDEFSNFEGNLLCKADLDIVVTSGVDRLSASSSENAAIIRNKVGSTDGTTPSSGAFNNNNNNEETKDADLPTGASSVRGCQGHGQGRLTSRSHKSEQKTTRVRTVLNEKQLYTLRTCYSANARPDALVKERLVEMTGLNPRVIRVWFQNKRCKDKKRSILMKQIQQQEKGEASDLDEMWLCQKGVPMIATSPVRHDPPPSAQLSSIEIQPFPAPTWNTLNEFARQNEIQALHPLHQQQQQQQQQQLMNSYGDGESSVCSDEDDDTVVSLDELSSSSLMVSRSRPASDRHGQSSNRHSKRPMPAQMEHRHSFSMIQPHHGYQPVHLYNPDAHC